MDNLTRCPWPSNDTLMIKYHDKEWGVPLHNDRKLFEFLLLEGFQAGLSWRTILHKRQNFRKAFDNFDFNKVAKYDKRKINSLMKDAGIIRNKLKDRILQLETQRPLLPLEKSMELLINIFGALLMESQLKINSNH